MQKIRLGVMNKLPEYLRQCWRIEPAVFGAEIGFDFSLFEREDTYCALVDVVRLLELCAEKTGDDCFGVNLAAFHDVEALGLVGLLGRHANNLHQGIVQSVSHLSFNVTGLSYRLSEQLGYSVLSATFTSLSAAMARQLTFFTMGQTFALLRLATGNQWQPQRLCFAFAAPASPQLLSKFFGLVPEFDDSINGFFFEPAQLLLPLVHRSESVFKILQHYVKTTTEHQLPDVTEQLKSVIRTRLRLMQSCRLEDIAAELHQSSRTLQSHLKKSGLSFSELLNEARFELACQLLETSHQAVGLIADFVGYADLAVFSRAFTRKMGISPSKYRAEKVVV